ncbi:Obg family GTPase CgtA [Entomospira culicis]|uniref:GTPase Obg n=1 Tax=Entomospira culicis TaxID=2719989 RepID=A0A968GFZ2_9SPIO|nr:GTPase ObgE [Entomospira culicis]NIZ19276.1 GTPase ObgE [Entomospira culicis]NIZ69819.1 GTPase ObgE [Entomospira culicis]WDI36926.1 GTPase ObgE [Entomospira culicis]WDI38555.1 GTPase ObgE [Entomospira culicis]
MRSFIDETRLVIASGNGGDGAVSFRREKYVAKGGPDGGDGGIGGNLIFEVRKNLKTFRHLENKHKFVAEDGKNGGKSKRSGAKGEDVVIPVPPGTKIFDYKTRTLILDLGQEEQRIPYLKGGKGGLGNWHFRRSDKFKQAPRLATAGKKGIQQEILLVLSVIADVGIVGLPNAGKSSLIGAITAANPKIANYAFTTKEPNLGTIKQGDDLLVIADIPGLIEGASQGLGLGIRFLKHLERTATLLFLIDMQNPHEDPWESYQTLLDELVQYNEQLLTRRRLIVGSKVETSEDQERYKEFTEQLDEEDHLAISVQNYIGLDRLIEALWQMKREHESSLE